MSQEPLPHVQCNFHVPEHSNLCHINANRRLNAKVDRQKSRVIASTTSGPGCGCTDLSRAVASCIQAPRERPRAGSHHVLDGKPCLRVPFIQLRGVSITINEHRGGNSTRLGWSRDHSATASRGGGEGGGCGSPTSSTACRKPVCWAKARKPLDRTTSYSPLPVLAQKAAGMVMDERHQVDLTTNKPPGEPCKYKYISEEHTYSHSRGSC